MGKKVGAEQKNKKKLITSKYLSNNITIDKIILITGPICLYVKRTPHTLIQTNKSFNAKIVLLIIKAID